MKAVADTRKPYSGLSRSLVIAIDVGTTFSGVSYAILEPGDIPKIHGVTRFPGQEYGIGNSKIPSVIYYDKRGEMKAAGAEADNANTQVLAEDEGWIKVELFKLRLRPRTMHLSMNGLRLAPLPPGKSPVHIFGDFLSYLYNCTLSFIRDTHANGGALLASIIPDRLEFVLAHPNGWEGAQQAKMRRGAVYGGLVSDTPEGRAKIRFVTEGEASLHACVLSGLAADVLSNPSKHGFLIADAGGGTLDISSYAIKGTHPLVMEEIAPPDCIFAGSVFVSRRAREFFEHKLKGSQYGTPVTLDHITKRFDETTKRLFRDRRDVQFVPFGSPIDKDPAYGIRTGQLRLTGAEVANLFEPSIDAAFNAIKKQIEACNGMIKSVFLVGGYAASPWLFTQLQERLASLNVVISRPDTQTSKAVADGAIGFYCDHHVSARMSKFMYGVEYLRQLDPNDPEHLARQEKLCELPSGPKLLPDAFDCILARGVKVKESTVFTRKYCTELTSLSMLKVFEVEIWCYRGGNTIPKWIERQAENFSTLCIVRADLSMLSDSASAKVGRNNKTYWTIVFSVEIHFGLTEFKARIKWVQNGETKYGPATIVYNERGHRSDEDEPDFFPEDDAITGNEPSRDGDRELTRSGSRPRTPVDGHYIDPSRRSTKDRESVRAPPIKNGSAPPMPIRTPSINLEKDRTNQYEMERKKSIASDREKSVPPTPILDRSRSTRNTIAQPSSPALGGVTPSIYSTKSRPRTPGLEYVDPPHPPSHRASPAKPGHSALFDSTAPRSSSVFDTATPPKSIFSEDPQSAFGTPDILGSGGDRPKSIFDNEAENPAAAVPPAAMGVFDQSPAGLGGDKNGGGLWGDNTWGGPASQAPAIPAPATPAPPTPELLTPAVPAESATLPPTASPALSTKSSKKKTPRGSPAISRANSGQGATVATPLVTIGENALLGSKVSSPVTKPLSPLNPASQQAVPEATPAAPASEDLPAPTPVTSVPATPAPVQAAVPPIEIPAPTVHSSTPGTPAEERTPITPTASGKKKKRKGSGAVATAATEKEKEEEEKKMKEEEELRKKAEEELKKKVEEDELKRKAEEDAQMRREEEEKKQGKEEGRKAKEAEVRQKEEHARKEKERLEQDAKEKEEKERLEKEEKERLELEEKERLQQEEADRKAKVKADREEKKKREKEEKERKKREEEERKKKEEEERLEKERLEKEERERKKKEKEEEKRKKKEEQERKKQEEEEARKKEEEDRLKAEEERKQKEEEERMKKEEEERKQKEEEARLKAEEEKERLKAETEQARQRAEDARLQAEKEEHEREMRRLQEEEDRVKRELEDLERQEKLAQEKSEGERKEKESNPLGFSFGGASSLFGNVSTSLFGNSSTNLFGSGNVGQQEEPTGLDWGFGSTKKNPKTPVETPQQQSRQSPFGWGGGSTFGGLDDKPTSTSFFGDVNVNPVFDQIAVNDPAKQPEEGLTATKAPSRATSPKPATPKPETPKPEVEVTQAEATEATEDDWGAWPAVTKGKKKKGKNASNNASQQPTRAPSPQPPADLAANPLSLAEENLEGDTWGHTAKGKKKGKKGKNGESEQPTRAPTPPPDAADAKNEDNLQDQLNDLLDNQDAAKDDWGAQPAGKKNKKKNKGGALDPEPEPLAEKVEEKDDLLDFLEGNNEPKEQKDDDDEWALPAKGKKKKKGKNGGNDDADPPTPIEKPDDDGLAAVGSGKKKKKGKK